MEIQLVCNNKLQKKYQIELIRIIICGNRIGNVESDVSQLQKTTQELFTSVSNGKSDIATAITDKGIPTASNATFNTMATNIRQIEGGIDTSDATATEEDIMLGKTAYVNGSKRYGTHVDLDTSDATAEQNDITIGKSAYINGSKIYGSHIETGVDTRDATATPYDIVAGKTAYVNGEKITGILDMSGSTPTYCSDSGVEKIYGGGTGDYTIGSITGLRTSNVKGLLYNSVNQEIIALIGSSDYCSNKGNAQLTFQYVITTQEGSHIGSLQTINISSIMSRAINMIKEYEDYSAREDDFPEFMIKFIGVTDLNIQNPYIALYVSTDRCMKECILILLPIVEIRTPQDGATIITYNIDFNNIKYYPLIQDSTKMYWYNMAYKMLNNGTEIVIFDTEYFSNYSSFILKINIDDLSILHEYKPIVKIPSGGSSDDYCDNIQTISVDRAIIYTNISYGRCIISLFDGGYNFVKSLRFSYDGYTKYLICTSDLRYGITGRGQLYAININWYTYTVTLTLIYAYTASDINTYQMCILGDEFIITQQNNKNQIFYFDPTSNEPITLIEELPLLIPIDEDKRNSSNLVYHLDTRDNILRYIQIKPSYNKLIGLKYNGEYFYKQAYGLFTAGQPDVKKGKTFIGWMGYPEIGTMETKESEE